MAGLYAIVGSMERARLMLAAGVPYLQLRFKERPLAPHREEVRGWMSGHPATRVIINDDLDEAVACGAWGVHLGQEDLARYPLETIRNAPLAVGISTHSDAEIERALACLPTLLGFGPIFATGSKDVAHAPQGLARLREVVASQRLPIVAIGGIGEDNLEAVAATGVALVAMIPPGAPAHARGRGGADGATGGARPRIRGRRLTGP